MPASEPRSPACGTARWTHGPMNEQTTLNRPIMTIVAMPMYHVIIAASRSAMPSAFRPTNAGPRTMSAIPIVEGVSRPSGIAVTVRLPVCFASRNAIHV